MYQRVVNNLVSVFFYFVFYEPYTKCELNNFISIYM